MAISIFFIGVFATALTDAWTLMRQHVIGVPMPNYGHVGRWIVHMRHGRFRHDSIARAAPVQGERVIGWVVHYVIGISFAALVPMACGAAWFRDPTPTPAVAVGLLTVIAPFLLMQPGMGAGIAARLSPRPMRVRLNSIVMHLVFGIALYAAALINSTTFGP
jgi:hypothetical protein